MRFILTGLLLGASSQPHSMERPALSAGAQWYLPQYHCRKTFLFFSANGKCSPQIFAQLNFSLNSFSELIQYTVIPAD